MIMICSITPEQKASVATKPIAKKPLESPQAKPQGQFPQAARLNMCCFSVTTCSNTHTDIYIYILRYRYILYI